MKFFPIMFLLTVINTVQSEICMSCDYPMTENELASIKKLTVEELYDDCLTFTYCHTAPKCEHKFLKNDINM